MTRETSLLTENTSNRILFEDEPIQKVKCENIKLRGEVAILRQNVLNLEKDNYNLKLEKSKLHKANYYNDKKKELEILQLQCTINDNKPNKYKRESNISDIDIKWALQHSPTTIDFKLMPFEYDRLKFFHDFFYDDFCQFDTQTIIRELDVKIKEDYKAWLWLFVLFSCKIDVFNKFYELVFINGHFIDKKVEFFEEVPLDWLINYKNGAELSNLNLFVECNYEKMRIFIHRVIVERPFIVNLLVTPEIFTKMIQPRDNVAKFLLNGVCANEGLNLINRTNLHFLGNEQLKLLYKDDYVDL